MKAEKGSIGKGCLGGLLLLAGLGIAVALLLVFWRPPYWQAREAYVMARINHVSTSQECRRIWKGDAHALERLGCLAFVAGEKFNGDLNPENLHKKFDDGTTTAECRAEVQAYWAPTIKHYLAQHDGTVVNERTHNWYIPGLMWCDNFDKVRISSVIFQPQVRLDNILDRIRAGGKITVWDKLAVKRDYPGAYAYPENEYRSKYLATAEQFFTLAGGQGSVMSVPDDGKPLPPPPNKCKVKGVDIYQAAPCMQASRIKVTEEDDAIYQQLDSLQAQGVGLVSREPPKNAPPQEDDDCRKLLPSATSGKFVPQPRMYMDERLAKSREEDKKWEAYTKCRNKKATQKLTSLLDEENRSCEGGLTDYPAVGMTDAYFRNCTIYTRFGGVVQQVVASDYDSMPIRLYVFLNGPLHRVYSINGVVSQIRE